MLKRKMRALCLGLFVAALPELVVAHGALVSPPSRNAVDRFLPAFRDGQSPQTPCTCPIGFRNASGDHGSKQCDQGLRAGAGGQPCLVRCAPPYTCLPFLSAI